MQESCNSNAKALELRLPSANLSVWAISVHQCQAVSLDATDDVTNVLCKHFQLSFIILYCSHAGAGMLNVSMAMPKGML